MNSSIVDFGERTIVRLLGKRNDVALAEGLVHQEGLLHEDVLRIGPDQARSNQFVLGRVDADVAAAVQLERRKHAIAFDHHLRFAVVAGGQPVIGIERDAQDRAGLRRRPLAIGLDRLVVIELARLRRRGTRRHLTHPMHPTHLLGGGTSGRPSFSSAVVSSSPTLDPVAHRDASAIVTSVPPARSQSLMRLSTRFVDLAGVVARRQHDHVVVVEVGAAERAGAHRGRRRRRSGARARSASSPRTAYCVGVSHASSTFGVFSARHVVAAERRALVDPRGIDRHQLGAVLDGERGELRVEIRRVLRRCG